MFLVLIKVDSGTAQRIAQSLQMFFTEVGLTNWISKLVALGADGASVNMGESGGVGAIIKKDIPHLIHIHCIAHKLELAVLDACNKVTYIVKFQTTNKTKGRGSTDNCEDIFTTKENIHCCLVLFVSISFQLHLNKQV